MSRLRRRDQLFMCNTSAVGGRAVQAGPVSSLRLRSAENASDVLARSTGHAKRAEAVLGTPLGFSEDPSASLDRTLPAAPSHKDFLISTTVCKSPAAPPQRSTLRSISFASHLSQHFPCYTTIAVL
ncbi:hypothetical protein J6590_017513 [Homalodisca vitripennis]|nr:hypothetical protein J6590_017513 [Homalodisca vitripennis]